jgi:hypothetical protein
MRSPKNGMNGAPETWFCMWTCRSDMESMRHASGMYGIRRSFSAHDFSGVLTVYPQHADSPHWVGWVWMNYHNLTSQRQWKDGNWMAERFRSAKYKTYIQIIRSSLRLVYPFSLSNILFRLVLFALHFFDTFLDHFKLHADTDLSPSFERSTAEPNQENLIYGIYV